MSPSVSLATSSPAWTAAGWTMVHFAWVGALFGLALAVARRFLRSARPEARYGVAIAGFAALTVAPAVIFATVFEPPARPAIARTHVAHADPVNASAETTELALPRLGPRLAMTPMRDEAAGRSWGEAVVGYLPWVWLGGSMLTLAMVGTGLIGVERLRRSSHVVEGDDVHRRCRALADSLGIARRVGVGVCDRLVSPVLIGIVRPLVLLPPAALSGWSVEQLEMALLHELAHLRRRDNLANLAQCVVESLLFFHPVVWWLSAWVRLEREMCCDRLVVETTGRSRAYAEMLVSLAGSGLGRRNTATAMADRQVATRIRRILNLEDRSMKLSLPEGFGLLSAAIVGACLALGAHAAPPGGESEDAARRFLCKAAEDVAAAEESAAPGQGGSKGETLISIARAQIEIGDRASALATLRGVTGAVGTVDLKKHGMNVLGAWEAIGTLVEAAKYQREAGDPDAARASLRKVTKAVETFDDQETRAAFERAAKIVEDHDRERDDRVAQAASYEEESPADLLVEFYAAVIEERIALGDHDEARALIRRVVKAGRSMKGPMSALMTGYFGLFLVRAGEPVEGRAMIETARRAALDLPNAGDKDRLLSHLARMLAESGDLDGAIAMSKALGPKSQQSALMGIIEGFAPHDPLSGWNNPGGIKFTIGAVSLDVKDTAAAKRILPRIALAARESDDAKVRARTLSVVAHLQAMAGDFADARKTAESMPDLRRRDDSGPSDGFYDAIRPATFALVASEQARSGDRPGAAEMFRRAESLTRAVEDEGQKVYAWIVLARKHSAAGDHASALAAIREAIPLAGTQTEPRRSRCLAMLSERQAAAGDLAGAERTAEAIRDYPTIEKFRAMSGLARRHDEAGDEAGDEAAAKRLARRARECAEAKPPAGFTPGKITTVRSFGPDTFLDPDLEFPPGFEKNEQGPMLTGLATLIGETDEAIRAARLLPAEARDRDLGQIAVHLAGKGDLDGALALAAGIETPRERFSAFQSVALWIPRPRPDR